MHKAQYKRTRIKAFLWRKAKQGCVVVKWCQTAQPVRICFTGSLQHITMHASSVMAGLATKVDGASL